MDSFRKDPDSVLPWLVDCRSWCAREGNDTVIDAEVILDDSSGLVANAVSVDNNTITIWLAGGVDGARGMVTCRLHTQGGRTEDQSFVVSMRPK